MGGVNQQIGWSNESKLLQFITKQLDRLTKVVSAGGGTVTSDSIITDPVDATAQATVQKTADLGNAVDGALAVQIVDAAGEQITTFGSPDVNLDQVGGHATDTNSGNKSDGTLRVVIATDQPQNTNSLKTVDDNSSAIKTAVEIMDDWDETNRAAVNLIASQSGVDGNSGNKSDKTLRVVLATDQPQLTNSLKTVDDNSSAIKTAVELIDNAVDGNYLNVNQNIAGTDVAAGAGAVNAQTQRITLASDDPAVALLRTLPMAYGEVYASPQDFTATYTSNVTITISGSPFTIDDTGCSVRMIAYKPTGGLYWFYLTNGHNGIGITASSNVITVTGGGTPFASGDTYRVVVFAQKKAYDTSTDTDKVTLQNPCYSRTTDPEPIIAAAQNFTNAYADLGYEVATAGYSDASLWLKITINNSVGVYVQILPKHTSAGTEEYSEVIKGVASGLITLTTEQYLLPDANGLYRIPLDLWNTTPYIQVQVKVTTVGVTAATIDTAYITKGFK